MDQSQLREIVGQFAIVGNVQEIKPLGTGLINDTFKVITSGADEPNYVLQRVNDSIFTNVEMLMNNIIAVTSHIRKKLTERGESDIDRKTLTFYPTKTDGKYYYFNGQTYWRIMMFIPDAVTKEAVNVESSRSCGEAFGHFEDMLADIPVDLGETIPDFHNMEFRLRQLRQAVKEDRAGRAGSVGYLLDEIESRAEEMCKAERLYREGLLPKRVCHCDTKVNNMMFDQNGQVLCVIDLDTVMPSFIFSDYGDFLRTGANTAAEDEPDLSKVSFNPAIFEAFTEGYLRGAAFLTPIEIENLPFAVKLFPYMQFVRFLWDYLNGDKYWKVKYPEHNLVRVKNQFKLLQSVEAHEEQMKAFVAKCKK
jgi:Ser/Thr protein kinase RdoA (MazF antagonist)